MDIKRVRLFVNHNEKSRKIAKIVREKLEKEGFLLVEGSFDLGIAIGGDGSFLRMVKESNFDSTSLYVGINAGTLGFAQEVDVEEIDSFITLLKNDHLNYEQIGVQEVTIYTRDSISRCCSLNEIAVRDKELNTTKLDIYVEGALLERYAGDGVLVATSFGSTAYNLSFGGSIVYNTFHTLQITPIAPLNNKSYHNLLNSIIIPDNKMICLVPKKDYQDLIITIDGDNLVYEGVLKIETVIQDRVIRIIRMDGYNFIKKINDKFIK